MIPFAALYERISVEDSDPQDSSSIRHQKELLEQYAKTHGYLNYRHFTDDGYTGRNFNRPGFQEMLSEIEKGHVCAVIVRDLSRLGRNYLEAGRYTEEVFPKHNVRFLALANDVDITHKRDALLSPFYNVINEWYSRELSRKITTTYRIKQQMGQRSFPIPMYGYRQDPTDPLVWRIDPPAAMVVRRMFRMALEGMPNLDIAKRLEQEHVLRPSSYKRSAGIAPMVMPLQKGKDETYWDSKNVGVMLSSPEYMGTMVLHKTIKGSHGVKKVSEDQRYLFPDSHEPIIQPENFRVIQAMYDYRTKQRKIPFMGLNQVPRVFHCHRCGNALHPDIRRGTYYFKCVSRDCPPPHQLLSFPLAETIVLGIMDHLMGCIEDMESLCNMLSVMRCQRTQAENGGQLFRREALEDRRGVILRCFERLKQDQENETLPEPVIRDLVHSFELELKSIEEEMSALSDGTSPQEQSPITEEDCRQALLEALPAFIREIQVSAYNPETRSQNIRVCLNVSISDQRRIRVKKDRKRWNFSWESPEGMPTMEERFLLLLNDHLIL